MVRVRDTVTPIQQTDGLRYSLAVNTQLMFIPSYSYCTFRSCPPLSRWVQNRLPSIEGGRGRCARAIKSRLPGADSSAAGVQLLYQA